MTGFAGSLRAEILRFLSRRLFRGLAIAILAMLVLQAGAVFFQSSNDPDSGLADARRDVAACEAERDRAVQAGQVPPGEDFGCPTLEEARSYYDNRFRYADNMRDVFIGLGILSLVLGLVVGASFMGAEWGSGSMTVLLTWEPRRGRVLASKVIACFAIVSVVLVALLLLVLLVFYPIGVLRGTTEGVTGSFWWTMSGTAMRNVFLGVFGSAVGLSLATLLRSTAGAVGAGFFYGAIVDNLLTFWRNGLLREWLLQYNVARLLGEAVPVDDPTQQVGPEGLFTTNMVLPASRGAIVLAVYGVLLLAIAYGVFRRRDVS